MKISQGSYLLSPPVFLLQGCAASILLGCTVCLAAERDVQSLVPNLELTLQEANERSFKLLQEYLAAAKTGGGIGRTAGLPYHFTFYLRVQDAEIEEAVAEPDLQQKEEVREAPGGFKKVALTLPPPVRPPGHHAVYCTLNPSFLPACRAGSDTMLRAAGMQAHTTIPGHSLCCVCSACPASRCMPLKSCP